MDNYIFIKKIEIKNFRAFSEQDKVYEIELGENITCISGHNGIGKSTILAMLSNCGEFSADYKMINGHRFRGEYSEIIKYDEKFDTTGEKCSIYFNENLPEKDSKGDPYPRKLDFRTTKQQGGARYRLIPKKIDGEREKESKIEWPVYYLGLSRLYPIGESESVVTKKIKMPDSIRTSFFDIYNNILNTQGCNTDSEFLSPSDAKKKKGVGITTDKYGPLSNSSGQDNLGQILLAVFSFEKLKEDLDAHNLLYYGGLLLIDELDATLHPAAQNKLFKFLYKKSKELNLQIVFTTHSLSLLEYIGKSHELGGLNTSCIIQYLRNDRRGVEILKNPTIQIIKNDLMVTYTGISNSIKIDVLTEDDTARWFLDKILKSNNDKIPYELNFYDCDFGFTNIAKLIVGNIFFRECLVIFDPDISQDGNEQKVKDIIKNNSFFTFNKQEKHKRTLLILPGNKAIETIIWEYIENLSPDSDLFFDPNAEIIGLSKRNIEGYIKDNDLDMSKLQDQKKWFHDNKHICEIVVDYWIKDNKEIVDSFIKELKFEYNKIAKLKGMKILE